MIIICYHIQLRISGRRRTTLNLVSLLDVCECSGKQSCFTSIVFLEKHDKGVFILFLVSNGCIYQTCFYYLLSSCLRQKNIYLITRVI